MTLAENLPSAVTLMAVSYTHLIICHVGDTRSANGAMPAGNYLAAWGTGSFLDTEPIYRQIREYIAQHQLTVVGNAYEERLIDEVASREKSGQVIQIKVQIL